tara:strand:- start:690 stop:1133 length:444 start_codon:yes stop_codon:yes gene_type:complete
VIKSNIINNYNNFLTYKTDQIKNLINFVFNTEKYNNAVVSIILSNKEHLNKLKKEYFNLNQYTDVLAFNLSDNSCIDGEIYISIDDVYENSQLYSESFDNEFKRVLIHGILHLIGYDDKEDIEIKKMRRLENKYLLNFNKEIIKLKC